MSDFTETQITLRFVNFPKYDDSTEYGAIVELIQGYIQENGFYDPEEGEPVIELEFQSRPV